MKRLHEIKLIVCDLDGTLLNKNAELSSQTIDTIHKANTFGINIALCSGRQSADIEYIAKKLNIPKCTIMSLNGSYCKDTIKGEVFIDETLSPDTIDKCIAIFNKYHAVYNCFAGDVLINNRVPNFESNSDFWTEERQQRRKLVNHLYGIENIIKYKNNGFNKITYVNLDDSELLYKIKDDMSKINEIDITSSWACNFEIMPKGINKGFALNNWLNKIGMHSENVISFGDNDNDISLLKTSGIGVAMGNANKSLKECADFITETNEENGVANFINNYILY